MSKRTPLLVLGLGNVLLGDDGIGSAAVALLLDRYQPPSNVRVLDGGTLGLSLLPYLEEAERVILVDAIKADAAPGTFVRLDGDQVAPAVASRLSPHQVGVADLLDAARWRDRYPAHLALLGLVPASMELEIGLSPEVAGMLPCLVERVIAEAHRSGLRFVPVARPERTSTYEAPIARGSLDIARLVGVR